MRVSVGPKGAVGTHVPLGLGATKTEIEDSVVRLFLDWAERSFGIRPTAARNAENDLDYDLKLPGGDVSLELTEFVLPGAPGSSPYERDSGGIQIGDLVDGVLASVRNKEVKYNFSTPVHLLVYSTHFQFMAVDPLVACLQSDLGISGCKFEQVFFLSPFDATHDEVRVLYPVVSELYEELDIESVRRREYFAFDPRKNIMFTF